MTKKGVLFLSLLVLVVANSGCGPLLLATAVSNNSKQSSTLGGGGVKGILTNVFSQGPHGVLLPSATGTKLSTVVQGDMDQNDQKKMLTAIDVGSSGKAVSWFNSLSGKEFTVTPQQAYYPVPEMEFPCRKTTIDVVGKQGSKHVDMKACKNPMKRGAWELRN